VTPILFISHDVVGSAMAGPGIRAAELARVLAAEHDVTLATPRPADMLPAGVRGFAYRWGDAASLAAALDAAELIVANGYVLEGHPELAERAAPLVLDMYDPTPLENLAGWRERAPAERAQQSRRDVALLVRQLRAGDCFLCATERQRDLYLGALLAAGRVSPELADADPTLRGLLRVVPFGLASEPPAASAPPWEPRASEQVILWSGGLWDWMDPLTLIRALPMVLEAIPRARLVFLAGRHPGTAAGMQMPERARALAAELGLQEPQIIFVDRWIPYAERAGALLHAAVAVYLHEASLESEYAAVRSRFLDHLWAGLPSVVSAGDAAAALVERYRLGRVAAPGDVAGTAEAMIALLSNGDELRACGERARALAGEYTWERVAAPLLDFCREPRPTTDGRRATTDGRQATGDDRTGTIYCAPTTTDDRSEAMRAAEERDRQSREQDAARNSALAALASSYQVAEQPLPGGLVGRVRRVLVDHVVRPFVAPLVERQNAHNAAVLRALDALAESADARRSTFFAMLDAQGVRLGAAEARLGAAEARLGAAEVRLGALERQIAAAEDRLADQDDNDTLLAERVAALESRSQTLSEKGSVRGEASHNIHSHHSSSGEAAT
jgi:glycosyltransferase involved in cell wall biosynthesis